MVSIQPILKLTGRAFEVRGFLLSLSKSMREIDSWKLENPGKTVFTSKSEIRPKSIVILRYGIKKRGQIKETLKIAAADPFEVLAAALSYAGSIRYHCATKLELIIEQ